MEPAASSCFLQRESLWSKKGVWRGSFLFVHYGPYMADPVPLGAQPKHSQLFQCSVVKVAFKGDSDFMAFSL